MSLIQGLVAGLVMVGVLVVIHEAGHFLVAKLFRIGTPVFSIGMGPRLFGFVWKGTDYRVSALPIGGYVRMAGADPWGEEDPDEVVDPDEDFMRKPVWQRLLVMVAGPAANLILPFVLFTAVLMLGQPQPVASVGIVLPDSPAHEAGVEEGDVVVEAAGEPVAAWTDLLHVLDDMQGSAVPLVLERGGQRVEIALPTGAVQLTDEGLIDMEALGMRSHRLSSRIGIDDPASPAGRAGLRTGDAIIAVDGVELETWNALEAALTPGESHEVRYARVGDDDEIVEATTTLEPADAWSPRPGDPLAHPWGLTPVEVYVGAVVEEMPAEAAGMQPDDRLYRVDGQPVRTWSDLIVLVSATVEEAGETGPDAEPRALQVELIRGGELVSLEFTPKIQREVVLGGARYRPLMGIQQYPDAFRDPPMVKKYYSVFEAVPMATTEAMMVFKGTIGTLANLATGELKPKESIGGPIEIFRVAGEGARQGVYTFAKLMGTISFSLGIINLLPVPVLDGGQIVFYSIEGIRGRPLSLELRERVQMVGVLALAAVMLMVTVMDVSRWLGG